MSEKELVVSVPGFFTQQERGKILDAAKLAEVKCLRLMNETSATALEYGIFRRHTLSEKPRLVFFVDIGYSKTSMCLAGITKKLVEIKAEFHERNLGIRDMDWIMYEYYCDMLQK
jgi:heat shock protein 4